MTVYLFCICFTSDTKHLSYTWHLQSKEIGLNKWKSQFKHIKEIKYNQYHQNNLFDELQDYNKWIVFVEYLFSMLLRFWKCVNCRKYWIRRSISSFDLPYAEILLLCRRKRFLQIYMSIQRNKTEILLLTV